MGARGNASLLQNDWNLGVIYRLFDDPPFLARPTFGGNRVLRGYIESRWRDDAGWEAATE